ncbi:unnamed protein product [Arctogadus glacialis]
MDPSRPAEEEQGGLHPPQGGAGRECGRVGCLGEGPRDVTAAGQAGVEGQGTGARNREGEGARGPRGPGMRGGESKKEKREDNPIK